MHYVAHPTSKHRLRILIIALTLTAIIAVVFGYIILIQPKSAPRATQTTMPIQNPLAGQPAVVQGKYLLNGTVTWARAVEQEAHGDYNQPFSQLNTFNRDQYDAWSTDFECPITKNIVPYQTQIKDLIFNCRPEFLPAATKYFNIFDLANNHTDNQGGEKGLAETRKNLESAGVQYFGTFDAADSQNVCEVIALPVRIQNLDKTASSSVALAKGETKAAIPVAMCGWHYFGRKPLPGELEVMDTYAKIMPVFAFVEMGTEYLPKATETQVTIAHQIMDRGPEFLIANNPHWVQNTEVYNGKLIVYSTGNFIFDQLDAETNRSASIDLTMTVPYDVNVAKWVALAPTCAAFHDDCLAKAQAQGLSKIKLKLNYAPIAGQNGYKVLTHKADAVTQKAVEDRLNWQQTLQALGQNTDIYP